MKKSLILCPSGVSVQTKDHWRFKAPGSLYDIHLISYNDYQHDAASYDEITHMKGMKWALAKAVLSQLDLSQYEYVGFIDDDLIFSSDALNKALKTAHDLNSQVFQLSLDQNSAGHHRILFANPHLRHSVTNFVEVMAPFIHVSRMAEVMDFWNLYEPSTGWGFDFVLCDILKCEAHVLHEVTMHHPHRHSIYDKSEAYQEQGICLRSAYPTYMWERYKEQIEPGSFHEPRIIRRELK